MSNLYRVQYTPTFHVLDYQRFYPSVQRLIETPLSINGDVGSTILQWNGKDASAAGWSEIGHAGTLALQAGTVPTYNMGSPGLGLSDDGIQFNAGGYFKAPNNTLGDIATEDFVIEFVCALNNGTPNTTRLVSHYVGGVGWYITWLTDTIWFLLYTVSGSITVPIGGSKERIGHGLVFCRRSGKMSGYYSGIYAGFEPTNYAESSTTAAPLTIGALSSGADPGNARVYYLGIHMRASGWLDTHRQDAIAAQRYALFTGSKPAYSYSGVTSMTSYGGAGTHYCQKFENSIGYNKVYGVYASTPRWNKIVDANGKEFRGLLNEASSQNKILKSDKMYDASWTAVACTVTANGAAASDGYATLDGVVGTAVDTQHGIQQAVTLTAANWVLSSEVRAGDKDWVYLQDATVANAYAYFQISTATYGTVGAGVGDKGVISYGGGLIKPWIRFLGTAAAHTINLYAAHADNDNDFSGDAVTNNIWLGAVQIELGNYPSSRVPTTTAAVTRAADNNYYTLGTGDVSTTEGALYFEFHAPVFTPGRSHYLCSLSASGNPTNAITAWLDETGKLNVANDVQTDIGTLGAETAGMSLYALGTQLYAGTYPTAYVFRYDGGTTWTNIGRLGTNTYAMCFASIGSQLYAGGRDLGRVYRYDGDTTWTDIGRCGSETLVNTLINLEGQLYAGTGSNVGSLGTVWRYDGGTTWTSCGTPGGTRTYSLAAIGAQLYAGVWNAGKVYSYDGGTSWTDCGGPGAIYAIRSLAVIGSQLYAAEGPPAGGAGRIYRYEGGITWTNIGNVLSGGSTYMLTSIGTQLYAASGDSLGIVWRYDGGTTWTSIGRCGTATAAYSLVVIDNKLYTTAYPSGAGLVWRYNDAKITSASNYCDNAVHTCLLTWQYNELKLYVDNVLVGTDTTVEIPVGLNRLNIGADPAAANNAGPALVSNVKIFPRATRRMIVL